jgi:hypothetical protein
VGASTRSKGIDTNRLALTIFRVKIEFTRRDPRRPPTRSVLGLLSKGRKKVSKYKYKTYLSEQWRGLCVRASMSGRYGVGACVPRGACRCQVPVALSLSRGGLGNIFALRARGTVTLLLSSWRV